MHSLISKRRSGGATQRSPIEPPTSSEAERVRHLLVIAGPSCVGKSTLLARLLSGEMPFLEQALRVASPATYTLVHAEELKARNRRGALPDTVVLHYELTRSRFLSKALDDAALDILMQADHLAFLTLWEYPEELEKRFRAKTRRSVLNELRRLRLRRAVRTFRRSRLRWPYFTDRSRMWELYRRWFDVCDMFRSSPHFVLRSSDDGATPRPLELANSRRVPFWEASGINGRGSHAG